MRDRTFRIRRVAVALATGVGTVGALAAGVSGVAGASDSIATGSTIAATSAPSIASTGSNQAAGNLTVTIASGSEITAGDVLDLVVSASGAGSTVDWDNASVSTSGINETAVAGTGGTTATLAITLGADSGASATVSIAGISYDTTDATGTLSVVATLETSGASPIGTFAPSTGVSNATLPATPPSNPTFTLTAVTTPGIGAGLTDQAAGNWQIVASGTASDGWLSGGDLEITVNDSQGDNCTGNDSVLFAATPSAAVSTSGFGTTTAPTVTPSLAYTNTTSTPCGSSQPNTLLLQFTNTGNLPSTTATFTITVSGVKFTTGSAPNFGDVSVSGAYVPSTGSTADDFQAASTTGATSGPSDADIALTVVTANSPAVAVQGGSLDAAISPITLTESSADAVDDGWVCITLSGTGATTPSTGSGNGTNDFDAASTPKVSVTSGPGTVNSTADFETTSGGTTDNTIAFDVTTPQPESAASTYQISGLGVDATAGTSGAVSALVTDGVSSATGCPTSAGLSTVTAYTVSAAGAQIYGADADGTAAAELEAAFPYGKDSGSTTYCPGVGGATLTGSVSASRSVVLATDSNYPDALAGAYLASDLGTGELLTPTNSLSNEALQALRLEGISSVYIVGGPLAISNAVQTQLESTPVYACGGVTPVDTLLGTAQDITVTRIYGQTEYDTAADIAQFPGAGHVGTLAFAGAYTGVNSSSGDGMYNDTSGTASTTASSSSKVPTAILATGQGWQDAEAASVLSYADDIPILLTTPSALSTQASTEMTALGIKQVIVMGGPLAISNAVVTSLQGLGMSVLRIAGTDYTDTAQQLADFELNTSTGGLGLGWTTPHGDVYVARGDFYSDGLAGAVDIALNATPTSSPCTPGVASGISPTSPTTCPTGDQVPLLLTENPTTVGQYLTSFLNQAGSSTGVDKLGSSYTITSLNILGGPLAVTPSTISTMEGDLQAG